MRSATVLLGSTFRRNRENEHVSSQVGRIGSSSRRVVPDLGGSGSDGLSEAVEAEPAGVPMSDLEVVLSLLVVWAAWVALTVADELVHARKVRV